MIGKWPCAKHKQESINFICTGNVWHFEPLCNVCVPEHTKNHPKNIKIQMQGVKDVIQRSNEIKSKVTSIYEQRQSKCKMFEKYDIDSWAFIKNLNQKRQTIINEINTTFDSLITQIKNKKSQQFEKQKQNLKKITQMIDENIEFLKREQYPDLNEFCKQIKKYYFKQNLEIYVEEIDQIINQYEQKTIQFDPFVWVKDITNKSKHFIQDLQKVQDKNEKKEKVQPVKKQTKKKEIGRKRCPSCKEQMEYLTQWKKHLICRNCGMKQRNYLKKS